LRGASVGSVRPGGVPNTNFPPFAGRVSAPLLCRIALAMSFSDAAPARPKTVERHGRVDWNNGIRALQGVIRARGKAQRPPSGTSKNRGWRPGARQQTALAGCEGMRVGVRARE